MKKLLAVLLSVLMICFAFGTALAYYPGDTVSVSIYLHHTDATAVNLYITYDKSALELTSLTSTVQGSGSANSGYLTAWTNDYSPLPSHIGTATFRIKPGTPAGTYSVSAEIVELLNDQYEDTSGSASAGSVTVEKKVCAEHSWDEGVVTTAPTCTTDGVKTFTCTECGEQKTESIPAAHDYQQDSVTAPTCVEGGYTTYVCSRCGDIVLRDRTDALGHDFGTEPYRVVKPTCTEKGYSNYQCNRDACRAYENRNYVDALGHDIVVEPGYPATCTTDGLTDGERCTRCEDATKPQEVITAPGHTPETVPGKEATCTEPGLTEGKTCSVCNEILTAQTVIPAKGHTPETVPGKDATCTETGLTEGKKCAVCSDTIVAQETIPAKGHTPETVPGKDATCTETGLTEGKKCAVCGDTIVAQETIPAKGHTPGNPTVTKHPTCTEPGLQSYKCTVCSQSIKDEPIAALGHDLDSGTVTTAPTCEGTGVQTFKCLRSGCDHTETKDIPANSHTEVTVPGTPATCTEDGLTDGKTCSVCQKILVDQQTIPALGHAWNAGEITTPTACLEGGLKTYTCTRTGCGETYTDTIPATGHKEVTVPGKEATCTKTGLTDGKKCSVCGEIIVKQETIPAKGHTEVTVPGKEATCTNTGLTDGKKCSVCGEITVKQETIPAKGHKEETIPGKKATCTEDGLTDGKRCNVCGVTTVKQTTIPAKGHAWNGGVDITPATCTTDGEKLYTCTACNVTRTETVKAFGHTRGEWVITRPVVNNTPGEKQRSCVTCGTLLETAVIPAAQYVHMTVSSIGPRFRDVCDVTDKWHMFTLIDLSQDGETLFDLVAGNNHLIGTMKVTVLEGQVTFTYELFSDEIKMTSEFLTIFPDLESVETLDTEKLTAYAFNEPISIADQLSGDTSVLVYVLCECSYRDDVRGLKFFEEDNPIYLQQLELFKQTQQP